MILVSPGGSAPTNKPAGAVSFDWSRRRDVSRAVFPASPNRAGIVFGLPGRSAQPKCACD